MATGARERLATTWAVATTGVAGPDPQDGEPVGTVDIAVAGPASVVSRRLQLGGDRAAIRAATVSAVLSLLRDAIIVEDPDGRQRDATPPGPRRA